MTDLNANLRTDLHEKDVRAAEAPGPHLVLLRCVNVILLFLKRRQYWCMLPSHARHPNSPGATVGSERGSAQPLYLARCHFYESLLVPLCPSKLHRSLSATLVPPAIKSSLPPHRPYCHHSHLLVSDALLLPLPGNRGYLHSYSPRSVSRETGSDRGPEAKTRSTKQSGSSCRKHAKNRQHGARPKKGQAYDLFHLSKRARRWSHHLVCRSGRCPTPTSQRLCLARHVCKCKCFFSLLVRRLSSIGGLRVVHGTSTA